MIDILTYICVGIMKESNNSIDFQLFDFGPCESSA